VDHEHAGQAASSRRSEASGDSIARGRAPKPMEIDLLFRRGIASREAAKPAVVHAGGGGEAALLGIRPPESIATP